MSDLIHNGYFDVLCFADCLRYSVCSSVSHTVIIGEVANFVAYAFAPAVLLTPLAALSIIIRYFDYMGCWQGGLDTTQ